MAGYKAISSGKQVIAWYKKKSPRVSDSQGLSINDYSLTPGKWLIYFHFQWNFFNQIKPHNIYLKQRVKRLLICLFNKKLIRMHSEMYYYATEFDRYAIEYDRYTIEYDKQS